MTDWRWMRRTTTCTTASAAEAMTVIRRSDVQMNSTMNRSPGSIDSTTPRTPPMAAITENSSFSPAFASAAMPLRARAGRVLEACRSFWLLMTSFVGVDL